MTKIRQIAIHPTMQSAVGLGVFVGAAVSTIDPSKTRASLAINGLLTIGISAVTVLADGIATYEGGAAVDRLVANTTAADWVNRMAGFGTLAVCFLIGYSAGHLIGHEVSLYVNRAGR